MGTPRTCTEGPTVTAVAQPVRAVSSRLPVTVSPWLLAFVALLPFAVARAGVLAESDTFWQVRAGLQILEEGRIPAVDSYSWTAAGMPWTLNSWGFDVLLGAVYRAAGLPGVAAFCAGIVAGIFALALLLARKLGASPAVAAGVLFLVTPMLAGWLSARPQLVDYAAVLVLVLLLRRLTEEASAGTVAWIGLLTVVWVNLHAAALLGVGITGASVVAVLLRWPTRSRWRLFVAAFLVTAAGALVNPYGVGVFAQATKVQGASAGVVMEWQHVSLTDPVQVVLLVAAVAALLLAVRRGDLMQAAVLFTCCVAAGGAVRFLPVAAVVAVPTLAAAASRPAVLRYLRSRRQLLMPAAAVAVGAVLTVAVPSLAHVGRPDPARFPGSAVVASIPAGCRVFNSYVLGGFLLLERPDVLVSVDSRNDLYGSAVVVAAERTVRAGTAVPAGAGCVMVPPTSRLAASLRDDGRWVAAAADPAAAVFVRG